MAALIVPGVVATACQTTSDGQEPPTIGTVSAAIGQAAGQSALLSGMHDIQASAFMQGATSNPDKGWITDLQYIGNSGTPTTVSCHGNEIAAGISIIQRLDVDSTHSFPDAAGRNGYATAFGAYVAACPQIHVWIVGNEPNITMNNSDPSSYATSYAAAYVAAWSKVHALAGHDRDLVLMSPASPFSPSCMCSMHLIIQEIVRQGGQPDGFAVHAYTQASSFSSMVAAVTSDQIQSDPGCGQGFHNSFRIYQDWIAAILAENQGGKPVFITEAGNVWTSGGQFCPGGCYPNQNIGYFQTMYQEIRAYNAAHASTKIRAVTLYRWTDFGESQSTAFAISTRPALQIDVGNAFIGNVAAPLTCDNNVSVGDTACSNVDASAEFVCTNPGAPSTQQWTRHTCPAGQTCMGTQCSGSTSCPYGSIQARVQLDIQHPWAPGLRIALGRSFIVGAFHDSSSDFVACCTTITVTGPNGFVASPGNDTAITPPAAGSYQVTASCGSHSETATVMVSVPATCSCGGGSTIWGTLVPASDTSCGFQVCGGDNQRYTCEVDGWHAAGSSPCNCRCAGGTDAQGRPINPDYTYCGYSMCGSDHQHYSCEAGGWSPQHDSCN